MPFPVNKAFVSKGNQGKQPAIEAGKFQGRLYLPRTTDQDGGNTIIPEGVGVHLAADGEVEIHDGSLPLYGLVIYGNNTSKYPNDVTNVVPNSVFADKESEVTVVFDGAYVIKAIASAAITAGAEVIGAGTYDTDTDYQDVSPVGVSVNPLGIAWDSAAQAGDMIRVLVRL